MLDPQADMLGVIDVCLCDVVVAFEDGSRCLVREVSPQEHGSPAGKIRVECVHGNPSLPHRLIRIC